MTLTDEVCAAWRAGISLDEPLSRLVIETNSRASGCWRIQNGFLNLVGFGWASDMPDEVSRGFQMTTRSVSLDQLGLGIVKAAVTAQPAVGRRDAQSTGLDGSASWITKFAANTSLAVPIRDTKTQIVIGVLAASTTANIEEGDTLWQRLTLLANDLGHATESTK
jgi:hypothetical protein